MMIRNLSSLALLLLLSVSCASTTKEQGAGDLIASVSRSEKEQRILRAWPALEDLEVIVDSAIPSNSTATATVTIKPGELLSRPHLFEILQELGVEYGLMPEDIVLVDTEGFCHSARLLRRHGILWNEDTISQPELQIRRSLNELFSKDEYSTVKYTLDVDYQVIPKKTLPKREVLDRGALRIHEDNIPVEMVSDTYRVTKVTIFLSTNGRAENERSKLLNELSRVLNGVSKVQRISPSRITTVVDNRFWVQP